MKKVEFSYDLYDKSLSRLESKKISEEKYNEILDSKNIRLIREWKTNFQYSKLYAKQYKGENDCVLFVWKEVWK